MSSLKKWWKFKEIVVKWKKIRLGSRASERRWESREAEFEAADAGPLGRDRCCCLPVPLFISTTFNVKFLLYD